MTLLCSGCVNQDYLLKIGRKKHLKQLVIFLVATYYLHVSKQWTDEKAWIRSHGLRPVLLYKHASYVPVVDNYFHILDVNTTN